MKIETTDRGFSIIKHEKYVEKISGMTRLVQESSAIGDYDNSFDLPGSSYLWIGQDHHLNREEVAELIGFMNNWLKTGKLKYDI
jgi:hypothetical protein